MEWKAFENFRVFGQKFSEWKETKQMNNHGQNRILNERRKNKNRLMR